MMKELFRDMVSQKKKGLVKALEVISSEEWEGGIGSGGLLFSNVELFNSLNYVHI